KRREVELERIKKDSEVEIENETVEQSRKLTELRNKHTTQFKEESKRLNEELENLKLNHDSKVVELKKSQKSELDKVINEQKEVIDNARKNYVREKIKWQAE
ncbi:MAG: hypothetical protein OEY33_05720, partial [Bdellovibrionales bacterium]|nr:hypothetical protein [Bdellovibrionales bacterium]